jgi:hypothetical protein
MAYISAFFDVINTEKSKKKKQKITKIKSNQMMPENSNNPRKSQ